MATNPNIGIRFPIDLLSEVDKLAGLQGRTRSEVVLDFVRLGLGVQPVDGLTGVLQQLQRMDDRLTIVERKLGEFATKNDSYNIRIESETDKSRATTDNINCGSTVADNIKNGESGGGLSFLKRETSQSGLSIENVETWDSDNAKIPQSQPKVSRRSKIPPSLCPECERPGTNKGVRTSKTSVNQRWYCSTCGIAWNTPVIASKPVSE